MSDDAFSEYDRGYRLGLIAGRTDAAGYIERDAEIERLRRTNESLEFIEGNLKARLASRDREVQRLTGLVDTERAIGDDIDRMKEAALARVRELESLLTDVIEAVS